jgi:ubiquinone/menaquinone biosynthesis C-methylase UbiE
LTGPLNEVREISKLAYGFMASKALFAALNVELFGHISKGARTIDELTAATGIPAHRLETLIAALVSCGLLVRKTDGLVNAPATETYLVPGATAYFGDYYRFQIGSQIYDNMSHLDAGLLGDERGLAHQQMSGWLSDPKLAENFSRAQHSGSMGPAIMMAKKLDLSGAEQLLDVAGGTGAYSITFCQQNPALRATILDFDAVIDVARVYVDQAGMTDRITLIGGDARKTGWPSGQDVVLMSYLLSAVDGADIAPLLDRGLAALRPGGRLIVHDFMLDETRSGPSSAALFFLSYLPLQPDAVSFTEAEMTDMVKAAGYVDITQAVMIPEITSMIVARKPK